MPKDKKKYRPNVGIMIIDDKKNIFVGQRLDHPSHFWQMPQGGIDEGEDFFFTTPSNNKPAKVAA